MQHEYQISLRCLRCKTQGVADVALVEISHTNQLDFYVDRVSKGFYVAGITNSPETTVFTCSKCGKPADKTDDTIIENRT